jgi:hypothetical protein
MIGIKVTGFDPLLRTAAGARQSFNENARLAVQVTAGKIKADAREGAAAIGGRASGVERTIGYTTQIHGNSIEAEIGYRRGMRRAALPLEVGTRHTAPKPVLRQALEKNKQDFYDGLAKAIRDSFR